MKNDTIVRLFALVGILGVLSVAPVMAGDEETPMAEQMEIVGGSLKKLRKADGFEAKAALARKAQTALIKSMQYEPAIFKDIKDPKAKAKAAAEFKRLMGLTLAGLGELELALLDEDEDKAAAASRKLKALKKEGHKAFMAED